MDQQVFSMLTERFNAIDQTLRQLQASLEEHASHDSRYWQKIDEQNAQLNLLKWLFGGGALALFFAWFKQKIGW